MAEAAEVVVGVEGDALHVDGVVVFHLYGHRRDHFDGTGTNDVGSKYTVNLGSVSIVPTGEFDFIGEDYGVIELQFTVNAVAGVFGTVTETDAA